MTKKLFMLLPLLLAIGVTGYSQQSTGALGLRIGDPIAVSYKLVTPTNKAIEFMLGTAPRSWHSSYYENSFDDYSKYDGYIYRSHEVENNIYLQARYLFYYNIPVSGMDGKLEWYWGVGALLKYGRVKYRYWEDEPGFTPGEDTRNNIDLGPDGIGGVEYYFYGLPLSVFGEVSLFMELADRPVTPRMMGGVGARVYF